MKQAASATETKVMKKVVLAKAEAYHMHRVLHELLSIWKSEAKDGKLFRLAFTFCVDTTLRRTFMAWHGLAVQGLAVAHLRARCFARLGRLGGYALIDSSGARADWLW